MALRGRSRWRAGVGWVGVVALLAVVVLIWGQGAWRDARSPDVPVAGVPADAQAAVVEAIVDGDTLRVRAEDGGPLRPGEVTSVRLLEIDAPEVGRDGAVGECGADAATAFLEARAPAGTVVHLEADREDRDQYGRSLRYVWLADGTHVNREIVHEGHARAVLFEPNDRRIADLRAAEDEARSAGRGVWGPACAG